MMRRLLPVCGCILVLLAPSAARSQENPPAEASKPKRPDIYDPKADLKQLVDQACARAKRDHSRVLVMIGGNWCGWCHKLHDLFKSDREIARTLLYEYRLVMADTEAAGADALIADWKADTSKGVPYLVVLDGDGKVVTRQETGSLEEGDHHDPKKVLDFLKAQAATPPDAQSALDAALARAASEDKRVFLHFGAPWCGWCHKLEDFMALPEIKAILETDFVDVKIDTDRMKGGKELLGRYCEKQGGIPWFVFLDAQGKSLVTSDAQGGNIGYPVEPHEIAHFVKMLQQSKQRITPQQIDAIQQTLNSRAAEIKSARPARAAG